MRFLTQAGRRNSREPPEPLSIDVAFVTLLVLEFLYVLVSAFHSLAALFLNNLSQGRVDILGHAPGIAADIEIGAFAIEPFPNLGCIREHFVLHVDLVCLIARPRAIEPRQKSIARETRPIFLVGVIAHLALRTEEEPVLPFRAERLPLL